MKNLSELFPFVVKSALLEKEEQLIEVTNEYKNYRDHTLAERKYF